MTRREDELEREIECYKQELDRLLAFVKSFINRWDETGVKPEDVNHEWFDIYREAKELMGEADAVR